MKYLIILLALFVNPGLASSQYDWKRIHTVNFSSVELLAEAPNGTLLAQSDGIYRSTNKGLTWDLVFRPGWSPQSDSLGKFYCLAPSGIHRSDDDGRTFQWIANWPFGTNRRYIMNGTGQLFTQSNGALLWSTTEGATWDTVVRRVYAQPKLGPSGLLGIQKKINSSSPDGVAISTDGGNNWTDIYTGSMANFGFTSQGGLIVSKLDGAMRTFDHGNTWDTLTYPDFPRGKVSGLHSSGEETYAIIADTLWASSNEGQFWQPISRANNLFRTINSIWIDGGMCLYRIDNDTLVPSNIGFFGLFVKRVFAFGNDTLIANQPFGVVRGTENAHKAIPPISPQGLGYADRFDYWRDTLYASGNDVMFSLDSGRSWQLDRLRYVSGIDSGGRFHEGHGYTTNHGLTYEPYNSPLSRYNDVKILPNSSWLIISDDSGCVSTDAGHSWRAFKHSAIPSDFASATVLSDSVWIIHCDSAIAMTEDAGDTWMRFESDSSIGWGRPTTDGNGNHVIAYQRKWVQQWDAQLKNWITFDSSPYRSISSVDHHPSGSLFIGTIWDGLYVRAYPPQRSSASVNSFIIDQEDPAGMTLHSKQFTLNTAGVERVQIYDISGKSLFDISCDSKLVELDLSASAPQVLFIRYNYTDGRTRIVKTYLP